MSVQINLQHVFKMPASRTHACFETHTPLVNGCVDDVLFNATLNVQQTLVVRQHFESLSGRRAATLLPSFCSPPGQDLDCSMATVPVKQSPTRLST